ncbi:MAG: amidohydrolase [Bacteroidota bacterium]
MSQPRLFIAFVIAVVLATIWFIEYVPQEADALYVNGRMYTLDAENDVVEAMAVRGDRIVGVGSTAEIQKHFRSKTILDLQGKTVLPGLIDAHTHVLSLGIARITVDLLGSASEKDAASRVKERVSKTRPGYWVRGRGWDQNLWASGKFPTHTALDNVSPENPVYLVRVDGHACWVNKKAMDIAQISKSTEDPPGGRIIRDAAGNPTGVFIDAATVLVRKFLPPLNDEEAVEAIRLATQECVQYGLTSVQDMGVDLQEIEAYKRLIGEDQLPLRVYAAIGGTGETWDGTKKQGMLIGYGHNHLTVRTLKMYIDGALGSRGAALIEPYSDDSSNRGLTVTSEEDLKSAVRDALEHGFQVCTHAIGDRGNNIVLNVYEAVLKEHPAKDHRLRVEHAQVLDPADIPRFKQLGVIPSMQPTHCTSDMRWAEARLGPKRIRGAYAWRSLLNTGVVIPGGSDFPVEHPNPIFGIYAACTRQDKEGRPRNAADVAATFQLSEKGITDSSAFDGGWYAAEKMTREEALRSFTAWAAWGAFEEHLKGSLEKGKLADFVVFSSDVMKVAPGDLLKTVVERTVVGGREVYRAP